MNHCSGCTREFVFSKKAGHTKKICNTCIVDRRRKKISDLCFAYKGTACICCGYDKCKASLCFHHLDPATKDFQISGNWGLSWKRIKAELDKCVLVCSNCHGEIHAGILNLGIVA